MITMKPVSRPAKIWDFASIKLHSFEPNLLFAGLKFLKKRKKGFWSHNYIWHVTNNDYILSMNASLV